MADDQTVTSDDATEVDEQIEAQDKLPLNVASIEDAGTLRKKVTIGIPQAEIGRRLDDNFGELSKTAQVPGFRIGRAPRRLIEKRFGKDVREQVRLSLIGAGIEQAIEQASLSTLGEPDVKVDDIELPDDADMTFSFEVEVEPEFELPKLDGIEVTEHDVKVTKKHVDEQIENFRWRLAVREEQNDDAVVEKGDEVTADVTLEIADQPPDVQHDVELVARAFPYRGITFNDMEKALVGATVGETRETQAEVPEDHENEAWRNKQAKLVAEVKKIAKWRLPELNEQLSQRAGFSSLKDWRDAVKTDLEARKGQQIRQDMEKQVRDYLLANTKFDLPEGLIERQTQRTLMRQVIRLRQMGVPPVLIEERIDELRTRAREQTVEDLKFGFVVGKIGRLNEIGAPDEEINGTIAGIAASQGRRPERLHEEMTRDGSIGAVSDLIIERKVLDKLLGDAKTVKASAKQTDPGSKKPKSS